ncbi:MAG: tetratricopeptide repeat protein [Caldilineaceae bacterium]
MSTAFEQQLKKVLKHFDNPKRIGEESPLASPYFLSQALQTGTTPHSASVTSPTGRGQVLCEEIRKAAATLWGTPLPQSLAEMREALTTVRQLPGTPRYAYLVLELRCFQQFLKPHRPAAIWEDEAYLPGSQAEHYRDFDLAVSQLGQALLARLHPTLRPEQPPLPIALLGYEAEVARARHALQMGQTVQIVGAGGIGKTTLGAALFHGLTEQPTFWFTVRPTFNDRLGSVLFALGHFLYEQGATNLWQLVVAAGGFIEDANLALSLLRQDLATLRTHPPVLCFDEFDRLYSTDSTQTLPGHAQILALVEGLRGSTPLLLMGQKAPLEADLYLTPPGFAPLHIHTLFQAAQCGLSHSETQELHRYTAGNPRLVMLCLALHKSGELLMDRLNLLPQTAGLAALFYRLWQRLEAGERQLLQRLAVFRTPAPLDSWPQAQPYLQSIVERRLASLDGQGGIELLPVFRSHIDDELSADLREQLHLEAAEIRATHGQYTAAAYHYWCGNRNAKAVQVWYPHQSSELLRGQGDAAFAVFNKISQHGLSKSDGKALALIQAELYKLQGELAQGRAILEAQDWSKDSETTVRARTLHGQFLDALGFPDAAHQSYGEGLATATRLLGQLVTLHRQRSLLHVRQKEMQLAWREARLAECQIHNLRGVLEYQSGRYQDAQIAFQSALVLAESLEDVANMAAAERGLANLYGRQQNRAKAEEHAHRALEHFQQVGDRFGAAVVYNNLASIYLDTQQYESAAKWGAQALAASKAFPYYAAIAATNLAEAYFELGELAQAQHYAYAVLNQEERQPYPYAMFTLGRIKARQDAVADAQKYFVEAARIGEANGDHFIAAYAQRELGAIQQMVGEEQAARQTLQAALAFFEAAGIAQEAEKIRQLLLVKS